jgi:hypothetical protein
MAMYVILSRFSPEAFGDPTEFKPLAAAVTEKIKTECPGIVWKESFATLGASMSWILSRSPIRRRLKKR